ncbi:hypothetical protein JCM16814_34550 [Desulfobaculum senezii]
MPDENNRQAEWRPNGVNIEVLDGNEVIFGFYADNNVLLSTSPQRLRESSEALTKALEYLRQLSVTDGVFLPRNT